MKNVLILSSKYDIIFDAITKYFKKRSDIRFELLCNKKDLKLIKKAQKLNIETFCIEKKELETFFKTKQFDLIILASFDEILSKEILKTGKFINIHSSLLPKYKTEKALELSFINKDKSAGITIYEQDEKQYEGKIIYQKEIKINPKWNIKKFENEITKLKNYYYPRIIDKYLKINVLVVGSSANEHAICEKITESKLLNKLYLSKCNDGFSHLGEIIESSNPYELAEKIIEKNISLVIINNEKYFANGLVNILKKFKINVIGANKNTAKLQSSKHYAKKLIQKHNFRTSLCKKISNKKDIDSFIKYFKNPIIKADGLTEGKGIFYSQDIEKTKRELYKYLDGKYSNASKTSLIEQKLTGYRTTLYSLWDGENIIHFPLCQNFKKSLNELYTSGLGAICPQIINEIDEKKLEKYKEKLLDFLQKEQIKDTFVICSELVICNDDAYIIEFNTKLCDPDCQVILNYIQNDWLDIFYSLATKMLNKIELVESSKEITAVVATSKGYPLKSRDNIEINNIENVNNLVKIYFSNIIKKDGKILSDGGKILSAVSWDRNAILRCLRHLDCKEKEYRIDILSRNKNI